MAKKVDPSEEDVEQEENPEQPVDDKPTESEAANALDKMTDVVPEEKQLDENRVKKAMVALASSQKADKEAARLKEKELAAVKVDKADIEVVALEFEMDKKLAERKLRECGGNLLVTLNEKQNLAVL
eukprot:gene1960-33373_t